MWLKVCTVLLLTIMAIKTMPNALRSVFVKYSTISILTVLSFFSVFSFPFNALYLFVYCLFLFSVFAFAPDSEVSGIEQYNKMCVYAKEVILKAAFALA